MILTKASDKDKLSNMDRKSTIMIEMQENSKNTKENKNKNQ
jgi:hypothetical protein